jgi:NitT/TauT family transport system substrate-binding protein
MIRTTFAAAAAALTLASSLAAQTAMPFALDWKFEGPAAPYSWPWTKAISRPRV